MLKLLLLVLLYTNPNPNHHHYNHHHHYTTTGIWSGNQDGTDINTVCRSHSGHLLASGDDSGKC